MKLREYIAFGKLIVTPNNGPPLHKHLMEDEAFYVLEGVFSFLYGNRDGKCGRRTIDLCPRGEFQHIKILAHD